MTGRSTISYAAMVNKNPVKSEETSSVAPSQPAVTKTKKINPKIDPILKEEPKEEFPELNKTASSPIPDASVVVVVEQPKQEPVDVVVVEEAKQQAEAVDSNDGEFIEKKKRNSDRNRDNKQRFNSSSQANRRPPQSQRSSQPPRSANRRPNDTNSLSGRRDSSEVATKTFGEKFDEEKAKYTERFKEITGDYCFKLVKGDLFSADENVSLAHCVSEDFTMSKGIATEFKKRFNNVPKLLEQNTKIGGCAYLKDNDRYLFYLVTKKFTFHKPYYNSIEKSLKEMRAMCRKFEVKDLAMPMIGSGLDRLDWNLVEKIIDHVFKKENLNITIYKFEKNRQTFTNKSDDNLVSASISSNWNWY